MKRFGVGETNNAGPPKTNAEPFRIQDYGQTAVQLEAAARQTDRAARHARSPRLARRTSCNFPRKSAP